MEEEKIAVLAGNLGEFNYFAKGDKKYIYIDFPEKAMGRQFNDIKTIGTWYERKDAIKLEELVRSKLLTQK